jgi:hypothetical protein
MIERARIRDNWKLQLLLVLAVAALLRFMLLGSKSLWFDEAFSAVEAQRPLQAIWSPRTSYLEPHPPLYYTMLHYWASWWGNSETAVRFPSALMSLLNVGLLYGLGRRLANQHVALLAAGLLAVSPLNIWYAQEARMYVFIAGAGLLYALLLTWDSWWSLPLLTLTLTLGMYTDYVMLLPWAGLSALWLLFWWEKGRPTRPFINWLASSIMAAILFSPWFSEFQRLLDGFSDVHLLQTLNEMIALPRLAATHVLLMLLSGVLTLIVAAVLLRNLLRRETVGGVTAMLIITLFLLATLLMPMPRLYGIKRLLVVVWPYFILLTAWLIIRMPRPKPLGTAVLALSLVASLITVLAVPKDDWRGAIIYINEHATQDAVIYLDPHWYRLLGRYYGLEPQQISIREGLPETVPPGELWLVAERFPGQPIPSSTTESTLDESARLLEAVPFYRLEVRRYQKLPFPVRAQE